PLKPMVPPAQRLLQKPDCGVWHRLVRIEMCPRSHGNLVRSAQPRRQAQCRIAIQVRPPAPEPSRTSYGAVVEAYRPVLPVLVESLVFEPDLRPEPLGF